MELGKPLAWFVGAARGVYVPIYPVWLVGEEPAEHQFVLALDEEMRAELRRRRVAAEGEVQHGEAVGRVPPAAVDPGALGVERAIARTHVPKGLAFERDPRERVQALDEGPVRHTGYTATPSPSASMAPSTSR